MKVKMLKTGKNIEVNDSYGARLVEQGKAVIDRTGQAKVHTGRKTAKKS